MESLFHVLKKIYVQIIQVKAFLGKFIINSHIEALPMPIMLKH